MNKKTNDIFFSDNLEDCIINFGYIERLRKSHSNHKMSNFATICLEFCQKDINCVKLMMRLEGFDVITINNDEISSVEFFKEYNPAKERYYHFKQLISKTKEEI